MQYFHYPKITLPFFVTNVATHQVQHSLESELLSYRSICYYLAGHFTLNAQVPSAAMFMMITHELRVTSSHH